MTPARAHPYTPGAPEVTGAGGVKGCAQSTRSHLRYVVHLFPPGAPHLPRRRTRTRRGHPTFPAGAPVPAPRTSGYGSGRRKRVRTKHTRNRWHVYRNDLPGMRG